MVDPQVFEQIAIEWYVRFHVAPDFCGVDYNSKAPSEILAAIQNPLEWRDDVIRWIDENHLLPRYHSIDVDDDCIDTDRLLEEVRERILPKYDNDHAKNQALDLSTYLCQTFILEPGHRLYNSYGGAEAAIIRSSIGRLLAETREDESITSNITCIESEKETSVPLSLWPTILERAWKQTYMTPGRGPDGVYYFLRNAQTLQNGIRITDELDYAQMEDLLQKLRSNCGRLGIPRSGVALLDSFKTILQESNPEHPSNMDTSAMPDRL